MKITGDQYLVKKINKSIVLDTIRKKSPISRAQVSEITSLNKATVSTIINELIEDHLVYEIGPGKSSGGRRPVMVLFNKRVGFSIGVDLGVNYIHTVLTDLEGSIINKNITMIERTDLEYVLSILKKDIHRMIQSAPPSEKGIIGIGIGIPGIINEDGVILLAPNLGWENVDLNEILSREFQLPIIIDNEANAGALGEKLYGIGKEVKNLIYLSAGIGIGTGIILNGELYRGFSGYSGEMGHFIIESNGKKCNCGNKGCWELYASENALLELSKKYVPNQEGIDLQTLVKMAENDDPGVINLFNHIGEYIGIGLTNIINTFNPELIIIGNRMSMAHKWMINPIQRVIESRALPYHRKKVRIEFSSLTIDSCALGAASLAISGFFTSTRVEIS